MTTPATRSINEFCTPIPSSERVIAGARVALRTRTPVTQEKVIFLPVGEFSEPMPEGCIEFDSLVEEFEQDPAKADLIADARKWLAALDPVLQTDPDLRMLRLRRGLSQTALARLIGTSQSHVARIESGSIDPGLGTCRRLATALDVDLNELNRAHLNCGSEAYRTESA